MSPAPLSPDEPPDGGREHVSLDYLKAILNASLDGIVVLEPVRDQEGRIEDFTIALANPLATRFVPYDRPLVGLRLVETFPGNREAGTFDAYVRVVETGAPFQETVHYPHDGLDVWIQVAAVRVPMGVAITFRDVTARKEIELALEARNRELQEFAYAASHDLQEPLRKIRAFADVLVADYQEVLPEEARDYVERMQAAASRMSTFIRDLLALSRVATRSSSFVSVEPEGLLAEVLCDLEIILRETEAEVEAGPLPELQADPLQLRQLFQNLIGNAVKFHRPGVRPVVRVRGRVETGGAGSEQVVFEIQDNGIGFEERYRDRIFAPFQRLHARERYEGSGVGLAICRRIAERHGGTLSARSVPGEGSTFIATFPRRPAERVPSEIATSP